MNKKNYKIRAKYIIVFSIVISLFIMICILDGKQQLNFYNLHQGYRYMEEEKYQNAIDNFSHYLSAHNSEVYWSLLDLSNGKNSIYSRSNVQQSLDICELYTLNIISED